MARKLRFPQGRVVRVDLPADDGEGEVFLAFKLAAIKASKSFAKLKADAPSYTDEEVLDLIIGHIAEGVV